MKIVLTGATGFIGSRLLEMLSKTKANEILVLSRKKKINKTNKKITLLNCSLEKLSQKKKEIVSFDPDVLIHLAWDKIPKFNKINSKTNEKNSINLITFFCKNTKIKHILVSGSCFEINPPDKSYNNFTKAKKKVLNFLKNSSKKHNIRYTWLRFFYVFGPNQRKNSIIPYLISSIKKKEIAIINEPYKRHDFIFIDDVCRAITNAVKYSKKSNILEVGSGKITNIKTIINLLIKISKKKLISHLNKNSKKNPVFKAEIYKTKKKIRWIPTTTLLEGLKKTFKSQS